MGNVTRRRRVMLFTAIGVLCLLAVAAARSPWGIALLKSKEHFIVSAIDERVLYEPGAEAHGEAIARALPDAVALIEREHGLPFAHEFVVYVCATQAGINGFLGQPPDTPIRGASVFSRTVFIAPRAFDFGGLDTHREALGHELSHLHLRQRLGYFRHLTDIPTWFNEGLADAATGSGGEHVSHERAIGSILSGDCFVPDSRGSFPRPKRARDYGVSYPMLHAQSGMFVTYLREHRGDAFREFLLDIQRRERFASAFERRFGADVETMWDRFVQHVRDGHSEGATSR